MNDRRLAVLVIALVLAGTLAFPSTAAPLFAGPTDELGGSLSLAPSSDYAYLEDDELVVDLSPSNPALEGEGVSRDGRTTISDVFRISYNGSTYAHVWLTHDADAVTFSVDGRPIESKSNNVTLAPNQSVPVSITIDTTDEPVDGLVDDITVHSRVADPQTDVRADEASADTVRSVVDGDGTRRFTALSTRRGGAITFDAGRLELDGTEGATLTFDRLSVGTTGGPLSLSARPAGPDASTVVTEVGANPLGAVNVTVREGNVRNATVQFSVSESYLEDRGLDPSNLVVYHLSDGDRSRVPVALTGRDEGRLSFEAETSDFSTFVIAVDQPRVTVTDVRLDASSVTLGDTVTVSAVVSNNGTLPGEQRIAVTVDDAVVAERTVTVRPGERRTIELSVTSTVAGEHSVTVESVERDRFAVEPADSMATTTATASEQGTERATRSETPTEGPVEEPGGFGLVSLLGLLTLLGLIAVVLGLVRRTPQ